MKAIFWIKYRLLRFLLPGNGTRQAMKAFFDENPGVFVTELYYRKSGPQTYILLYWEMSKPTSGVFMSRMEARCMYDMEKDELAKEAVDYPRKGVFAEMAQKILRPRSSIQHILFSLRFLLSIRPRI